MSNPTRRVFVKDGALALLALGLPPTFLPRTLAAQPLRKGRKVLIAIFQRGAVDGLSMVVPFGEAAYYRNRRAIALPAPGSQPAGCVIDLDGFFGLHPSLEPLQALWARKELAIVHAAGSPDPSRSHFDAQDFMESATPGVRAHDGWLNRVLQQTPCLSCDARTLAGGEAHAADHVRGQMGPDASPLQGVAMAAAIPRSLHGAFPTLAVPDFASFGVGPTNDPSPIAATFERMYRSGQGDLVSSSGGSAFDAIALLKQLNASPVPSPRGIQYPAGQFGTALKSIAQLIKADVGLEIAFTDITGWDTHAQQGNSTGALSLRFRELARGLSALYQDLGDLAEDVVVITMSEFGRTVAENGSAGTDHGHGNCMMVLGGSVAGGRVYGDWPGLEPEQLYERRDLKVTTDFRDVFAEVASKHLGTQRLDLVFPGYAIDPARFRGVMI